MIGTVLRNMPFFLLEAEVVAPDGMEITPEVVMDSAPAASSVPYGVIVGLCAVLAAICVGLIVVILLQKKRASGIGAAIGGGSGDTYWSKNKGKSVEGSLEKYTKWGAAAFILIALVINVLA